MNMQTLQYFIEVTKQMSISKAAENMNISQQAMSSAISRLESEMNSIFFERSPHLSLTYAGEAFLNSAKEMLNLYSSTKLELEDIESGAKGSLKIGISYTRGQAILPLVIPAFRKLYPAAEISIIEATTKELEAALENEQIDVMIGFAPVDLDVAEMTTLLKDKMYVLVPKVLLDEHFGENAEKIKDAFTQTHNLSLFADMPFVMLKQGDRIRAIADNEFRIQRFRPQIVLETKNIQTASALASEGLGITFCPQLHLNSIFTALNDKNSYIRDKLWILPLYEEGRYDTIAIGYNTKSYLSHMAKDFISLAIEKCKDLQHESV